MLDNAHGPTWSELANPLETLAACDGDYMGGRFSRSPSAHSSSDITQPWNTRPASPNQLERDKETRDRMQSSVYNQFLTQTQDERNRIFSAESKGLFKFTKRFNFDNAAMANVKDRWIQQGIWNSKWKILVGARWKHEEPVETDANDVMHHGQRQYTLQEGNSLDTTSQVESNTKTGDEFDSRLIRLREREASRPCYQFVHQCCKEREWIRLGLVASVEGQNDEKTAYQSVKSRWVETGIWDPDWFHLPGPSWRHEMPRRYLRKDQGDIEDDPLRIPTTKPAEHKDLSHSYHVVAHEGYPPPPPPVNKYVPTDEEILFHFAPLKVRAVQDDTRKKDAKRSSSSNPQVEVSQSCLNDVRSQEISLEDQRKTRKWSKRGSPPCSSKLLKSTLARKQRRPRLPSSHAMALRGKNVRNSSETQTAQQHSGGHPRHYATRKTPPFSKDIDYMDGRTSRTQRKSTKARAVPQKRTTSRLRQPGAATKPRKT